MLKKISFIFILCFNISFGNIIIDDKTIKLDNFSLPYFQDKSRAMGIEDIVKLKFDKQTKNKFVFGYVQANSWFKFTITNNTQNDDSFILYLKEPFFEYVNFYEHKKNQWLKTSVDIQTPINERLLNDIHPTFKLKIPPSTTKTFYLSTYAKFTQYGSLEIHKTQNTIINYQLSSIAIYLFYFGGLFIIMCFNLFLFFTIKDRIYIYYVSYIFLSIIFVVTFSGLDLYFGLAKWHHELYLVIPPLVISLILFTVNFLETKKHLPFTYKLLQLLILAFIILEILSIIDFNTWHPRLSIVSLVAYTLLLYTAVRSYIKKVSKAQYYLFAMVLYIVTVIMMSSMVNGLLEINDINRYSFIFGSFVEILIFNLLLASRFSQIQKDKIKAQDELLLIKHSNEQFLENEVEIRTHKIQELLEDKELLLKEVYHRVKNNFQVVMSMLYFESSKYNDESYKLSFAQLINRIKSMSLVHQFLYKSETLSQIKAEEYILKIIEEVEKVYVRQNINITSDIDSTVLSMDEAMALGIIINELLNNSIKHHISDENCKINLMFKAIDNTICLTIQDNGEGFIPDENSDGLGLNLIKQFANKLNSSQIQFIKNNGTSVKLTFLHT
ncbi:MAG: 7TM diverse intracellular signaling domain-containing protein [Campylobacterota bacterium]|nr:7TM diverse intracellular signaling domain-containing protein [Campylobacterota bacterium]